MEAKKSLGQHFLRDSNVLLKIADELKSEKNIVEIGAGRGALSEYIAKIADDLTLIELDRDLVDILRGKFAKRSINIINADAKEFRLGKKCAVAGNLPYNASKRIIRNFINQKEKITKMLFMVQEEVADTIIAHEGTKDYSKFSIFVQIFCRARKLFTVNSDSFYPPPKVKSAVVELVPYKKNIIDGKIDKPFFNFLNVLFMHPRKTVKNNLKGIFNGVNTEDALKRPGDMSILHIYKMYKEYIEWKKIM